MPSTTMFFRPLLLALATLLGCAGAPSRPDETMSQKPFLGLRTALYRVTDLARAKEWYSRALDTAPYFDQPFYVGYDVGGFELGLLPDEGEPVGPGGVVAYWGVADADAALKRLLELGAQPHEPVKDVGEGIRVATVKDPFGNHFGVIENPHFKAGAQQSPGPGR